MTWVNFRARGFAQVLMDFMLSIEELKNEAQELILDDATVEQVRTSLYSIIGDILDEHYEK